MPDLKISQLPAAQALTGPELLAIVQAGETRQSTINELTTLTRYTIVTSARTAVLGDRLAVVPGIVITAPLNPATGTWFTVFDHQGGATASPIVINRNGQTIAGLAENLNIDVDKAQITLVYTGSTWSLAQ